jgi:hypothetical protein
MQLVVQQFSIYLWFSVWDFWAEEFEVLAAEIDMHPTTLSGDGEHSFTSLD